MTLFFVQCVMKNGSTKGCTKRSLGELSKACAHVRKNTLERARQEHMTCKGDDSELMQLLVAVFYKEAEALSHDLRHES